jgi:hypothetical protein
MAASFAAVLAGDLLGWAPPLVPEAWRDTACNATELFAVAACAVRTARATGPEPRAWLAFTIGLFAFFAGDVYWTATLESLDSPPFPSPADAGYLGIYPASYVGLVLLLRARAGRIPPTLWLDGLISAPAVAAVAAALVFGVVATTEVSFATVATDLAYPLGDLALPAFVFAVITVTGRRLGRTWLFIAGGSPSSRSATTTRGRTSSRYGWRRPRCSSAWRASCSRSAPTCGCADQRARGHDRRADRPRQPAGARPRPSEALRIADQRMYVHKRGGRRSSEETVHQVLLSVVGEHDGARREHVDDVAHLADLVARRLGLDDADVAHVRRAAALHDVGKIAIPDAILHTPRRVTDDEGDEAEEEEPLVPSVGAPAPA